jgi:hypothetical protein
MNVVLYTKDLEPVTVIDMPVWVIKMGRQRGVVQLPVPERLAFAPPGAPLPMVHQRIVAVWFEQIRRRDAIMDLLITDDDEFALLLKPGFLPGQRGAVNQLRDRADKLARMLTQVLGQGRGNA